LCPFHDDREPSLVVSPKKNLWHCLGACQAGGTVIDWVMKAEGVSFRHAVELLRADVPVGPSRMVVKVDRSQAAAAGGAGGGRCRDARTGGELLSRDAEAVAGSAAVSGSAGLTNPELVDTSGWAYANRTLGLRLPPKNRKAGDEMRERLEKLGVIRESGHEHFNGSIVIPVFDAAGAVVEMYGRKITENLRAGTPLHLYLPGEHRGVWNEKALEASKEIILCESLIDAMTFWCAGFRNVTASYGVNGFTDDHRAAFRKDGVTRVWIAYDRDEAGEKAAAALGAELMAIGIECFRVLFPKGMDANEYALKVTPAEKSLGLLLNKAEWMGKGKRPEAAPEAAKEETVFPLAACSVFAKEIDVPVEARGEEIVITLGDRRYRVRGLQKNLSYDLLKINLLASRTEGFHVDTLDLYSARQRTVFVKQAALEMQVKEDVVRHDLGRVLLKLEEMQDEQITKALDPKPAAVAIDEEDRAAALGLLRDPDLTERILRDFERCGVVGEETNKLTGYIAAVSRHLEAPLAVILQSSSAAGKSSLMDSILAFLPEEHRIEYSAMTGQSLFYMGETDLKNKVLAIVEEEGASRAAYALKLLAE
jgi:DNA primase